ncbi:MAG TPA: Gfo/Idh/MocA family oxidoreductase, partial [Bacteroidales bacterium]|nr:Gfo/Idh/MocA family oxidoreductase [Bacteroidales bacterium]
MERRDLLKSLVSLPVVGAFGFEWFRKRNHEKYLTENIRNELNISTDTPEYKPVSKDDKLIRIGLIGYGIRGKDLAKAAGFAHPTMIDEWKKGALENKDDDRYEHFLEQDSLNLQIAGVCDIFDTYGRMAQEAGANALRQGTDGKLNQLPKRYLTHQELLADPTIDAVIIAAPDHWHGPISIAAAKAGKHVYCEKPMTWTVEETYEVRKAIKENNVVFQLGHQGRQNESYLKAKEIIAKGVLGKVNLIEVTTNRNDPNGAWVYPIHPDASPQTIDWNQ